MHISTKSKVSFSAIMVRLITVIVLVILLVAGNEPLIAQLNRLFPVKTASCCGMACCAGNTENDTCCCNGTKKPKAKPGFINDAVSTSHSLLNTNEAQTNNVEMGHCAAHKQAKALPQTEVLSDIDHNTAENIAEKFNSQEKNSKLVKETDLFLPQSYLNADSLIKPCPCGAQSTQVFLKKIDIIGVLATAIKPPPSGSIVKNIIFLTTNCYSINFTKYSPRAPPQIS